MNLDLSETIDADAECYRVRVKHARLQSLADAADREARHWFARREQWSAQLDALASDEPSFVFDESGFPVSVADLEMAMNTAQQLRVQALVEGRVLRRETAALAELYSEFFE